MSMVLYMCSSCKKEHKINLSDFDVWEETENCSSGLKREIWMKFEDECECGHDVERMLNQTEYPIGVLNDIEVHSASNAGNIRVSSAA
ncbi:hypothetical protein [Escherichia coli]|uniref:hypothetical protein n=1 Tax=Escherichia coli TaxID=562 RepID=UPI0015948BA9|nr:hypothetical protein [Escherichia coli]NVD80238.1 hypothetical protein [Escherichia coli]